MLIKRNDFMTSGVRRVKKVTRTLLSALAVATAAIAPAAFAGDYPLVDKTVTVKFQVSELRSEDGIHKVYAKLKKTAKTSCRSDSRTLWYLNQSVKECAGDLMDQFIESADIETLTAYHVSQNAKQTAKIAEVSKT